MMKQYPILACLAILLVQTACTNYDADDHKFGNVVYFDIAETTDVQTATIKNTLDELDRTFSATLAYPSEQDVTVFGGSGARCTVQCPFRYVVVDAGREILRPFDREHYDSGGQNDLRNDIPAFAGIAGGRRGPDRSSASR